MKNFIIGLIGLFVLICIVLVGIDNDQKPFVSFALNTKIVLDDSDLKVDWSSKKEYHITLEKSINIWKEGTYYLDGSINNGSITINSLGYVRLVLNNVNITNNNGPCLIVKGAEVVVIELKENSVNNFIDGKKYKNDKYNGCIYSKDDLIFQGNGTLNITSNYQDGIVSNDDLKFNGGTYIINSNDDAINGKDSIYIVDGTFNITSNGDSFKTTNLNSEKGFIYIRNANIDIESYSDGFDSTKDIVIENIKLNISTRYRKGEEHSKKGIKAENNLIIENGELDLNTFDDCINVNNSLLINNGDFILNSGDDVIKAEEAITIQNGNILIEDGYEGLEAHNVTINNGNFNINVRDDGINVKKDDDIEETEDLLMVVGTLTINGGKFYINALGDGLDINGNIEFNDSEMIIDGPISISDSAIDYNGYFNMNGGFVIGLSGSNGMVMEATKTSKQYSLMYFLKHIYDNKEFTIEDKNGNILFKHKCIREVKNIFVSSKDILGNSDYILKIDGKEISTINTEYIFSHDYDGKDRTTFKSNH